MCILVLLVGCNGSVELTATDASASQDGSGTAPATAATDADDGSATAATDIPTTAASQGETIEDVLVAYRAASCAGVASSSSSTGPSPSTSACCIRASTHAPPPARDLRSKVGVVLRNQIQESLNESC